MLITATSVPCLLSTRQSLPAKTRKNGYVLQTGPTIKIVAPSKPKVAKVSMVSTVVVGAESPKVLSPTVSRSALSTNSSPSNSPAVSPRIIRSTATSATCSPTCSPTNSPNCSPLRARPTPFGMQQMRFLSRSADQLPGVSKFTSTSPLRAAGFRLNDAGVNCGSQGFEVRDFHLGCMAFEPKHPALRQQLLAELGVQGTFEPMRGFHGGLNEGIWFLKGGSETLVLKLVKYDRYAPPQLVEERIFSKLYQEIPSIAEDPHVAFPFKVLRLLGPNNVRRHDLIVMRKAPGKSLDYIISEKWRSGRRAEIMAIFRKVGETFAQFHRRYGGRQHNDAGTQNILFDEETQHVTLIDVGGMGNKTDKTDVERLSQVVRKLATSGAYGPDLAVAVDHFREGYAMARA